MDGCILTDLFHAFCHLLFFSKPSFSKKKSLRNTLRVSKSLEPDQSDTMSGLISAEDIGRQIVEAGVPLEKVNCNWIFVVVFFISANRWCYRLRVLVSHIHVGQKYTDELKKRYI